ncbi:MAG: hypothetical protein H9855_11350 [Candidatus Acinetobacter avistercoris]|uniref:hypothetical protein n=1 Tax=Acinetobacter sp. KS-LM10 TaxID=3120518 RepID=UPI001F9733A7|nr:hypothetical protein [Candidatus Acinetobacter avistercoris]
MKFIQQSVSVLFLYCLSVYLTACQSAKQQRNSSLSSALQPYIGQSMASIQKNIDLERFNVALHPQPSTNKDQLVYLHGKQLCLFLPVNPLVTIRVLSFRPNSHPPAMATIIL